MRTENLVFATAALTARSQDSAGDDDANRKRSSSMRESCQQTAGID